MEPPRERESLSIVNIEIFSEMLQLLRHSYAMSFPPGMDLFRHLCPHLNEICAPRIKDKRAMIVPVLHVAELRLQPKAEQWVLDEHFTAFGMYSK